MKLKFCANLGFLFCENSNTILQKYELAKAAGFRAVEHPFPAGFSKEDVLNVKNKTNLEVALLNIDLGSVENGQLGITAFPGMEEKFKEHLNNTVDMAKALNCKKIHIMAGKLLGERTQKHHETYVSNLKYASKLLESENIVGVIEPINHYSVPGYYLNDFKYAIDVIKEIGSENIKLMVDLFHMQILNGNIVNSLKEFKPYIGHVQIAQSPDRNEPNSKGELDLKYILNFLETEIYQDWIGCEYKPKTTTEQGLNWVTEFQYSL